MMSDLPSVCPHADRERLVEDYLAHRLSEDRAEEFEAHYFGCDACYEAVELAASLKEAFRTQGRAKPASSRRGVVWRWAAAAAVVFAVSGLAIWRLPDRSGGEGRVMRGTRDALALTAARSDSEIVMKWSAVPEAAQYEVRVFGGDGELLREVRTEKTRAAFALSDLPPGDSGRALYARVEALDTLRQPVARSRLVRVRPPGDKEP